MTRTTLFYLGIVPVLLNGAAAARAADAERVAPPRFSRHVVPLFSRLGCNAGACHGMVQGKGGFRLSLFGVDPTLDHGRLLREASGRRINLLDPDASLVLLKATGQVPHEGGKRTSVGSPEYRPSAAGSPPALDLIRWKSRPSAAWR